ncbi:MAG: molybdopterin-dependent oxidoreductase [Proteobacteria bacterium]|nr:molybdopterin-dependent oxidoreductase [Pseudomonadota bacterium]
MKFGESGHAEALGVDYRRIRVIHGQTDRIDHGVGAHASRATVMTGSAVHIATLKLRAKALGAAAGLLQAPAEALDIVDGFIVHAGNGSGPSVALGTVAGEDGLASEGWHHTDRMTYPYGLHIAQVRVDPGTGAVAVERYLIAYDVGRAINPMLIEGQIAGGYTQGLGGALFEEFLYDENGVPLCVTFADYLVPTLHEAAEVEVLLTEDAPSPLNPLGIKGAGEAGVNAVGAAIASAIDDAIAMPGAVTALPVTPQRLLALIAERRTKA